MNIYILNTLNMYLCHLLPELSTKIEAITAIPLIKEVTSIYSLWSFCLMLKLCHSYEGNVFFLSF